MKCSCCVKADVEFGICKSCAKRLRNCLMDLPKQVAKAHECLSPSRGGHGTNSGEPTIGVNVTALDWITGRPVTDVLWRWEIVIRTARGLTKPALLEPAKDEVRLTVAFHLAHLNWTVEQDWIDEFFVEVMHLHREGQIASQTQRDPVRRIPCPAPHPEDDSVSCRKLLAVESNDLTEPILCSRCKTNWTPARLVAVAMSDPHEEVWLDIESIANWIGLSERQCRRLVRQYDIERKSSIYNFSQFLRSHRANSI